MEKNIIEMFNKIKYIIHSNCIFQSTCIFYIFYADLNENDSIQYYIVMEMTNDQKYGIESFRAKCA